MAIGDIYELVDTQYNQGANVLNVYHYRDNGNTFVDTGNANRAGSLLDRWIALVLPAIRDAQGTNTIHNKITCTNKFDASDAKELNVIYAGTYGTSGESELTTFDAVGFIESIVGAATRKGQKRLAGVPESVVTNGVIDSAPYTAKLLVAADKMARPITVGTDIPTNNIFFPVVVKRVRSGTVGAYEYRFPENIGEAIIADITGAVFRVFVTSQVSRKVYGGG